MAKDSDNLAKRFDADNTGGVLSGLLAEEEEFDRRALWRLGSWAVGSVGAVVLAMVASQSSIGVRRDQMASADLLRQSQQVEQLAKDTQKEAGRLASAVEILNNDRDRLYSRVAVLEQGLDSVTGTIARQGSQPAPAQAGSPGTSPTASSPVASQNPAAYPRVASPTTSPNNTSPSNASQGAPSSGAASPNAGPPNVASSSPASPSPASPSVASPGSASPGPVSPSPAPLATLAPAAVSTATIPPTSQPAEAPATAQKTPPAPVAATPAATVERPPIVASGGEPGPASAPSAPVASASTAQPAIPPVTSLVTPKSMMGPPDPAASRLIEPNLPAKAVTAAPLPEVVASVQPAEEIAEDEQASPSGKFAVQRTEFGVDVGGANSIPGLRALWRGLLKSKSNAPLATLRPIIVIREGHNGLGMQLRLVAGPISDAAAAAKICAAMIANDRTCTTAVFEGQRLAMNVDEPTPAQEAKPASEAEAKPATTLKPSGHKHFATRRGPREESGQKPEPSGLSAIFGRSNR